jgi:hypothetical protein
VLDRSGTNPAVAIPTVHVGEALSLVALQSLWTPVLEKHVAGLTTELLQKVFAEVRTQQLRCSLCDGQPAAAEAPAFLITTLVDTGEGVVGVLDSSAPDTLRGCSKDSQQHSHLSTSYVCGWGEVEEVAGMP